MNNKIREYENRYWLKNDDVYELHFTRFYDDEIILKFIQDKDDSENYIYVSQFEDMVVEHIQEEICYYEEMLKRFKEEMER